MTKIAIISDSHDNLRTLDAALRQIGESGAEVLLHCGDLCAPFVVARLAAGFAGAIHIVFGNNDGDGRLLQINAAKQERVQIHGPYAELEVGARRIAMIHYPEPALRIAQSGQLDLVCYGHNHTRYSGRIGAGWLVNPGEIMGMQSEPTWALYDGELHTVEIRAVEPSRR